MKQCKAGKCFNWIADVINVKCLLSYIGLISHEGIYALTDQMAGRCTVLGISCVIGQSFVMLQSYISGDETFA